MQRACGLAIILLASLALASSSVEHERVLQAPLPLSTVSSLDTKESNRDRILDTSLSRYIQNMTELWSVKGTTVVLVRQNGKIEHGAWGISSEDGAAMTPDVWIV